MLIVFGDAAVVGEAVSLGEGASFAGEAALFEGEAVVLGVAVMLVLEPNRDAFETLPRDFRLDAM